METDQFQPGYYRHLTCRDKHEPATYLTIAPQYPENWESVQVVPNILNTLTLHGKLYSIEEVGYLYEDDGYTHAELVLIEVGSEDE